jgi:hypothetical protein
MMQRSNIIVVLVCAPQELIGWLEANGDKVSLGAQGAGSVGHNEVTTTNNRNALVRGE